MHGDDGQVARYDDAGAPGGGERSRGRDHVADDDRRRRRVEREQLVHRGLAAVEGECAGDHRDRVESLLGEAGHDPFGAAPGRVDLGRPGEMRDLTVPEIEQVPGRQLGATAVVEQDVTPAGACAAVHHQPPHAGVGRRYVGVVQVGRHQQSVDRAAPGQVDEPGHPPAACRCGAGEQRETAPVGLFLHALHDD